MGVDRAKELCGWDAHRAVEIDDLTKRVHSRVRPAAAVDAYFRFAGQHRKGRFERFLHGAIARLRLPALKIGAVVAQD